MIQEHKNVIDDYIKRRRQRVKMMMIEEYRNVNFVNCFGYDKEGDDTVRMMMI